MHCGSPRVIAVRDRSYITFRDKLLTPNLRTTRAFDVFRPDRTSTRIPAAFRRIDELCFTGTKNTPGDFEKLETPRISVYPTVLGAGIMAIGQRGQRAIIARIGHIAPSIFRHSSNQRWMSRRFIAGFGRARRRAVHVAGGSRIQFGGSISQSK
jgi:hypothetical protein